MQHGQHQQKPQQEGIDVSQNNIIYKATVTTASSTSTANTYIGKTENGFKTRFDNQKLTLLGNESTHDHMTT